MASAVIHICVAKEVNKYLKRNENELFIGTIAPDISRHLNKTKEVAHFLDNVEDDIPNLERFLEKYKTYLNDDFVMGYYIHLYTDYLWFKYLIPNFIKNNHIYTLDGKAISADLDEQIKYIYSDYTNLNIRLIDEYELTLNMFYEEIPNFKNIIKEIPMDKLKLIVDKTGLIITESKKSKPYLFDLKIINNFIEFAVSDILANIEKI